MEKLYNIKPDLFVSNKIALVGNSDCLLNTDYSKEIDSFDDVMRFNFGDIKPKFTGKKTTIRWINCPITVESVKEHRKSANNNALVKRFMLEHFSNTNVIAWNSLQNKIKLMQIPNVKYYEPNQLCMFDAVNKYLEEVGIVNRFEVIKDCWPRTGFHAIITCLKSNITPYLYGFDIEQKEIIKHYSLNTNYNVSNMKFHQVDNEIAILNELKEKELIIVKN